jgi:predicted nucleic acid-binding protein
LIIVDTSVWLSHLREGNAELGKMLNSAQVMCHPFIIGEIACGNIKNRSEILALLRVLPQAIQVAHEEVLYFIESNSLMGSGLGYVDMHLCASARLTGVPIWTFDKALSEVSKELKLNYASGR